MAITMKRSYSVDLQKGAEHAVLRAPLATMDNLAHIFEVQVNEGGSAADLSGAVCEAYFIRADGVTVTLDGTVSGSTASVTLGANCYAVPGRYELAVKLTQGGTVHTILRVEGSVTTSRTDTMTGAGTGAQSFDQLIQTVNGAVAEISKRDRVWNLLDNSDFRNPVNQRGQTSYATNDYAIDRWKIFGGTLAVVEGQYIAVTGQMYQLISGLDLNKTYTFAVANDEGICVVSGKPSGSTTATIGNVTIVLTSMNGMVEVIIGPAAGHEIAGAYWAALYEGEYTVETFPGYMPKGFAAELLECQRYFLPGVGGRACGCITGEGDFITLIPTPVQMRALPSVQAFYGDNIVTMVNGMGLIIAVTDASAEAVQSNGVRMVFSTDLTDGDNALATAVSFATNFNLSAEL